MYFRKDCGPCRVNLAWYYFLSGCVAWLYVYLSETHTHTHTHTHTPTHVCTLPGVELAQFPAVDVLGVFNFRRFYFTWFGCYSTAIRLLYDCYATAVRVGCVDGCFLHNYIFFLSLLKWLLMFNRNSFLFILTAFTLCIKVTYYMRVR